MDKEQVIREILSNPKPLSDDQRDAVLSEARFVRVIAGAGAGKTETLTRRIVYLLLVEEVEPASIVAFTFTEKAAQSMKSRIYQRILQMGREDLAKHLGEMYVGTIHGFCLRILQDLYGYGNYGIFDENQEMAFLMRIGWSLGLNSGGFYSENCNTFLNNVNMVYSENLDRDVLKKKATDFFEHLTKYESILDDNKRLTFGRMVHECVLRLQNEPEKLEYIKYLIVDEFQDIDKSQYILIKTVGNFASVFVVGDPRQSIYQWRGSDERFFHNFLEDFGGGYPVEIHENRRSTKKIVEVSNEVADNFTNVDYEHLSPTRSDDGKILNIEFRSVHDEAVWVADQIERLVKDNGCNYSDFGILLRSVNTSGESFIDIFKERRIPFIVGGKVGLFRRDEAQAVGRLLSWLSEDGFWVENSYDWRTKVTGDDLLTSGLEYWRRAVDFELPDDIITQLENWRNMVLSYEYPNFKNLYYALLIILGYQNFDLSNQNHLTCMANLGRFSSLISDYEIAIRLDKNKCLWKSECKNICWYMNTYASKAYEEQAVDDIHQINAVQFMTIHQAKGLEWPIVFLPALVKKRFPSSMAGRQRDWLLPRDLFDVERYEGGIEEEKRLFYVAVTRARDKLILSRFSRMNGRNRGQSIFLDMLEDHPLIDVVPDDYELDYAHGETVEEEEIQTFSTTELIDYMRCPHHYRLNKMWGYIQDFSPLIGYGEALHYCLRMAAEMIKNGYSPISAVANSVDEHFFLPFASSELLDKVKNSALDSLVSFAEKNERDLSNIVEVETRLEFPVQNATLIGKVDVIMKDEDSYEIRDYKSSDKVISDEDSAMQLRLYTLGLRALDWKIDIGSIAYLEDGNIKPVIVNDASVINSKETAEHLISSINRKCFNPIPSSFCEDCEYKDICRRSE